MPLDYSKTGPLGFRALKQNSPFNIKNYQEDMKEPLPDTKGYQWASEKPAELISPSYGPSKIISPQTKPLEFNPEDNLTIEDHLLQFGIVPTRNKNSPITADELLDRHIQSSYIRDINSGVKPNDIALKYSKNIRPYAEEFNEFYTKLPWFSNAIDQAILTGNIGQVESLFNNTMAANQSSARKYRNGVSQMGGQVYNFVGSVISFAANLFGAGARTIGEIGNSIGIENDYKWSGEGSSYDKFMNGTMVSRWANQQIADVTEYGTPLFGQQYENKMSGRNPNKIWLSDKELNNPWKPTAGNIAQNLIANFGFTIASMGLGGLISYGSKGIQSLALANNITKMNALRSSIYNTGLIIQKNIPPILGTFEAYSEASTGTEQVKKSTENQINSFYHNSINNYLYDSLGKIVGNDTNELLPILEEMGASNYDENVLMKYGINPIEFKKVIAEAEYNREIQNEQLGNELLKNFAITFGINSVINGFANHYILSPLWSKASNTVKVGGRFGKYFGNPTLKSTTKGVLPTITNNKSILNKPIVRTVLGLGSEGTEELLQEGTNAFSESITNMSMNNLFADQYNTDNTEYFKKQSYIVGNSLIESFNAMLDPNRGLYAFALGSVNAGLMITPRFGNAQAKSKLGKAIQMRWAPAEMYRDQKDKNKFKEESINAWNEWVANPENKDHLLMVNAAMANEEFLKGQTIPDGATLFDIKNKKLEQIFHAISLAKKAGVSDEYINTLQKFNSDLTSAINDPTSSKANELVKAAINNGMLAEEDLLKPEVVKNTLQQIKDNSSKMLELFPEITKAEKYISEKYGETLEPEIKSKLIYGNIQRKNWIKRKDEIESTMQSPEMKRIADEIDEEFNVVSSLTADELTILKYGQTASKASKTILDRQFKIDKKINILNNTIAILKENNSQNSGTKNESIEKRRASKIIALENQKKQLLDEKRSIVKISRKLSKAEKSIVDHDKEIKFTATDFISLPIEDQHAIIEQYKNNQLDAQNNRVIKEILDRSKLSFEKDNKTSYEEAARDYSTLQNSLNSLEKDLIIYEKDPTRLRVEAHIAETKIKMQAFYDKINERINELEQLSDIELRSAYKNLQDTVNNIKLDENGVASTEEDRINQAVLNTLNNSKLEGSPLGKKLSNIQDIESKIEDVSEILSNSNFDDFSISFVDDLHTFLLDNNIDPQNEKEVERFLLSNNEENLLKFIVEYSTNNAEILNQPDFIPANMISQEVTPYSINGVYMTKSDILGLVDIMTYAVKQAYNNKLNIVPNTEGLATEEELFGENEVLVEDIETKFDNKLTGNTEEVITEDNTTTESTENTKSEITQEEIAELEEEGAVFIDIDVTDRDDYFWSTGMFSTEGPIVEYFAEHNVMSYLQSGRLKYYIIKRTPGDTKTAKDNNNASKLKFIIDENLIKEVKLSMESEGKKYNPHIHLPIVVVTEDKNGTLLYEGKNYQVVSVIANGQKKLHPFMETFMTDYVKKSRIKSNKLSMVVQNGVPITTLPVKAIPTNSISSVSKLKQGEIPVHVSATNSRKDGLPIVKVPLKDLNKDLSGGLPGTEQTGIYRIFDDQGNWIEKEADKEWQFIQAKKDLDFIMFLSNKKNTTSKEDILVFNHSLTTMDNGDFVSKLSNIIDRMQSPVSNMEVLNKELKNLLDSNASSNKIGSKTIELTRKQVENTIRAILNLPIDYTGESDNSIIVSQGENYDIVNELSKYIMFPRGMKVQGGKHITINQPKKVTVTITPATETTPAVTAETLVENLVDVFNGTTINKETLTEEDIQNLTNKALAQLLIADGAKFVVNYNDITIAPGESSAQKKAKKLTLKRLLSDGILYSDQKTIRRPSKRVTNMSPDGFTLSYDLAMHTPEALKKNVRAKLAEMNQQVVSTEPVSTNDSNFSENNSTVIVDNKEISTSTEVVKTENTPKVVEVITSESKENSLAIIEDLKKNSEIVPKIKNESHYTNTETNEQLDRVTSVIKDTEVNFDDNVDDALRHGNEIDNFIRDYFNDNLKELTEYPFVEKENVLLLENFVKQLDILRDWFTSRGETVISDEIVLFSNELKLAGTTDIITVDKEGKFRIYDIKTMKGNHFVEKDGTGTKTKFDSLIFGKSKRQLYHEQLSLYNIILQNSHGVSAVELAVIPIQLSYDQLSPIIKSIKILDKVFYTPLSSVGPYSVNGLATPKVVSTTKENIPVENKTNNDTTETEDTITKPINTNNIEDPYLTGIDEPDLGDRFLEKKTIRDEEIYVQADYEKEFTFLRKILPQVFNEDGTPSREAIEIVEGLIQVSEMGSNENGDPIEITREVHGKYNRAKMTLGTDSVRGTSYHEAMHFILDLFFTPTQKGLFVDKLRAGADFKNAQIENLTAEEAISEVFRKGLNEIQEGNTSGEFSKFFNNSFVKKVFFRIRAFFGLEEKTINELFYNILSGKYARKEIKYKGTSYERHLEINTNSIKEGVTELFNSNPELANIGTQEQYSQYLDTIFPDSKVKDIVYHRSNAIFDKFDKSKIKEQTKRFYFSTIANSPRYGKNRIAAILNVKNLAIPNNNTFIEQLNKEHPEYTKDKSKWFHLPSHIYQNADKYGFDGVKAFENNSDEEYSVYEPEQIHILGSKQDIEGFKAFVNNEKSSNTNLNSREQMIGSTINVAELMQIGIITYTNEDGQPCASAGMNTGFTKGFPWKIVESFKGKSHAKGGIETDIKIDGKLETIEVENNELQIQNDNGDIAIIPSKYKVEVQDMISGKCWTCLDALVDQLPLNKDFAQEGFNNSLE